MSVYNHKDGFKRTKLLSKWEDQLKKKRQTNQVTKPKWSSGFSSSLSVFRSGPSSHLTGALHAGVLRRNRRRHHGQDALWRLTVTVHTGGTGRPGNAGCAGNTTGSPLSVTTVFAVSLSTGVTWKKSEFLFLNLSLEEAMKGFSFCNIKKILFE